MTDREKWPGGVILKALPAKGKCMTLDELVAATGFERDRITRLVDAMNARGLITNARVGCYRRSPAGDAAIEAGALKPGPRGRQKPRGPGQGCLRSRLWKALRMLNKATLPELLEIAGQTGRSDRNANQYLALLAKYGVTVISSRRVTNGRPRSNGYFQHILLHNLGPLPPMWSKSKKTLINSNKGVEIPLPTPAVTHE